MARIQIKSQTFAEVDSTGLVLPRGQQGHDPVVGAYKTGDGVTRWDILPWDELEPFYVVDAAANGVSDDTAAIQSQLNQAGKLVEGGGSIDRMMVPVVLRPGKHYRAAGLSVPYGVLLDCNGAKIQANAAGTVVTLADHHSAIRDGVLAGDVAVANLGIYVAPTKTRCQIRHVTFDTLGGRAILCEGLTTWISDCMGQGCLALADGLLVPTGVLEINTTDCWVTNCEFTASRVSSMSAGGFAYAVVLKGGTHMLNNVIAEISDGGFHIASTRTSLSGCRADLNRGHGYTLAAASGGSLTDCLSLSNGIETNNTFDGYNFAASTHWSVSDCRVAWSANGVYNPAGNKARFGFNDVVQSASFYNKFSSTNFVEPSSYVTAPISVQNSNGSKVDAHAGPFTTMTANVTTWSAQTWGWPQSNWRLAANTPTNFTDFTNEVPGMELTVIGDGQTTFVHNASVLRLLGGANLLAASGLLYRFVNVDGVWVQI